MIEYFDTSALAKRYVTEPGSSAVRAAFRRGTIVVARITYAEVLAAVARACRLGAITSDRRIEAFARIEADFNDLTVIEVRAALLRRVPDLLVRHPLRGYDVVQLATALTIHERGGAVRFWSADGNLAGAAVAEGLRAVVPGAA